VELLRSAMRQKTRTASKRSTAHPVGCRCRIPPDCPRLEKAQVPPRPRRTRAAGQEEQA
jgi:hypothetical protein